MTSINKKQRQTLLAEIKRHPDILEGVCPELRANKEFMLAAIGQSGDAFDYAAAELKTDVTILTLTLQKLEELIHLTTSK